MAIQFQCVSCSRPIEVDDQWARRLVECPYCHDTITVPAISTYNPPGMASPVQMAQPAEAAYPDAYYRPRSRNALAIWAMVLSILAFATLGATIISVGMKFTAIMSSDATPEEMEKQVQEAFEQAVERQEHWVILFAVGMLGGLGLWIAGLVCSMIAVTRPARRGLAIAALLVTLLPIVILLII